MTAPSPEQVEAICKRLTKAQRVAVIRGGGFSRTVWAIYRMEPRLFASATSYAGEGTLCRPTPLGLAVRAALQSKDQ